MFISTDWFPNLLIQFQAKIWTSISGTHISFRRLLKMPQILRGPLAYLLNHLPFFCLEDWLHGILISQKIQWLDYLFWDPVSYFITVFLPWIKCAKQYWAREKAFKYRSALLLKLFFLTWANEIRVEWNRTVTLLGPHHFQGIETALHSTTSSRA